MDNEVSVYVFAAALFALAVAIAIYDFRQQIIPDGLNAGVAVLGAAQVYALTITSPPDSLAGAVAGGLGFWIMRKAFKHFRGIDGLGFGDVKFAAAGGIWVGLSGLSWFVLFGSLSGLMFAAVSHMVGHRLNTTTRLAFGPHLAAGLVMTWIFKWIGLL
jgi:leader peptidase (prepilin peptidase)/N-methyltransferase